MPEQEPLNTKPWKKYIFFLASAFFLTPNLMYLFNAWFVRHRADDFCFSGTFREFGFLGGLSHFYLTISNRFSAFMLWSFSDLFGEKAIRIFSLIAIIFTSAAIFMAAKSLAGKLGAKYVNLSALLVSQILTFFFLYLSPTIHQSVYWRAAMVHYFLPFPALLLMLRYALVVRDSYEQKLLHTVIFFLLAFFLAGLSESYAALQGAAFAVLLIYSFLKKDQSRRIFVAYQSIAVVAGTVAALLLMIVSPGNTLKMTLLDQAQDLGTVISISLNSAWNFIFFTIRGRWLPFLILFLMGVVVSIFSSQELGKQIKGKEFILTLLTVPLMAFLLIVSISAPTAYGMLAYPENRVLMLALMVLVSAIFAEGFLLAYLVNPYLSKQRSLRLLTAIAMLILSFYPLLALKDISEMISFYRERAQLWDRQQGEILGQIELGQSDLVVTALDAYAEIAEMRDYNTYWVNLCTAQYYNVDTITAVEHRP